MEEGDGAEASKQTEPSQKETSYTKEKEGTNLGLALIKLTLMLHRFPEEISSAVDLQLFQGSEKIEVKFGSDTDAQQAANVAADVEVTT